MDKKRFQRLIEAYGATPERWPELKRAAGLAYLARSPEAADDLEAARALDLVLDAWTTTPADLTLQARIIAKAGLAGPSRPRQRGFWLTGAGLAAACAAGILVGVNFAPADLAARDADTEALGGVLGGVTLFGAHIDTEAKS